MKVVLQAAGGWGASEPWRRGDRGSERRAEREGTRCGAYRAGWGGRAQTGSSREPEQAPAFRLCPRSRSLLRKDVNAAVADTPRLYSTPEDLTDAEGLGVTSWRPPCFVHRRWAWAARASPPVRFACPPIEGLIKLKHPVYNGAAVTVSAWKMSCSETARL